MLRLSVQRGHRSVSDEFGALPAPSIVLRSCQRIFPAGVGSRKHHDCLRARFHDGEVHSGTGQSVARSLGTDAACSGHPFPSIIPFAAAEPIKEIAHDFEVNINEFAFLCREDTAPQRLRTLLLTHGDGGGGCDQMRNLLRFDPFACSDDQGVRGENWLAHLNED